MRTFRGFTLIELLIALVIMGVLAAIAYPTFQTSALKSRRAHGEAALVRLALDMEQFRSECPVYATVLTGTRTCDSANGLYVLGYDNTLTPDGDYSLRIADSTANTYLLRASAVGQQRKDVHCQTLTLDQDGQRGALNASGDTPDRECW